jgi:hypothetical protein
LSKREYLLAGVRVGELWMLGFEMLPRVVDECALIRTHEQFAAGATKGDRHYQFSSGIDPGQTLTQFARYDISFSERRSGDGVAGAGTLRRQPVSSAVLPGQAPSGGRYRRSL